MPLLDHRIEVATPEGVTIELAPAGPMVRIAAFSIDLLIRLAILIAANLIFSAAEKLGTGLFLLSYFLVDWFYPVLFEVVRNGQTPGKKAMSIAVVQADGTPVSFSSSLLRNLLRSVDFLPFGYLFGFLCMIIGGKFQRLGDLVANSLVIHVSGYEQHEGTAPEQAPVYLTTALTEAEQQAIIQYSMRASSLSTERRAELTYLLSPELLGETDKPEQKLLGVANGLMGRSL